MFDIQQQLKLIPDAPGVYIMKNQLSQVIYVGKAISLKNRVRQYFQSSRNQPPKVQAMVENITSFEYIVTDSELEALILECNLIKKHLPKYNVLLRDDKTYPFIKITTYEDYPRVIKTRCIKKDNAKYFGPYTSGSVFKETMDIIHQLYPIRTCKKNIEKMIKNRERPCLNYHIKKCIGPCTGKVSKEQYQQMVDEIVLFLSNRKDELKTRLHEKMLLAAKNQSYEKAATYRDQLKALDQTLEKQKIVYPKDFDQDAIAIQGEEGFPISSVELFIIRKGKLIHREQFTITSGKEEGMEEVLTAFIKQYYSNATSFPKELLIERDLQDKKLIEEWLTDKKGAKVEIKVPKKGEKKKLLEMVKKNAAVSYQQILKTQKPVEEENLMEELKQLLHLEESPERIEAYDISNMKGLQSVGSMVVFKRGKPQYKEYRRFKIKTIEGPNDYGSLQEIVERRFTRGKKETWEIIEGARSAEEGKFTDFPDLILVDGGFGQVSSVEKALRKMEMDIPVCGMIKDDKHKTRGLAYKGEEILMDKQSSLFRLIFKIQEEVHRFAISYHKTLRKKEMIISQLNEIDGIGDAKRKALLKHFGSVNKIKEATIQELMQVKGITVKLAENIKAFFQK